MPIITPPTFRHENLYMDAEIQAVVEDRCYDFTGRRYFHASLFGPSSVEVTSSYNMRNNIGFGITNINVDISTSLQPIIEITFKDLYGNTVFGNNNSENINYQVLFNWPPPKFLFTYKGYLGRQVSYMLSVKKIDTQFVSQDASYDIKVTFVPHQWGFFADIPFYFLKAVKGLKKRAGLLKDNPAPGDKEHSSLVDLIEIGALVEQSTQQITSKYDELQGKMIDYRADIISSVRENQRDEEIKGVVDGQAIADFQTVQVVAPNDNGATGFPEGIQDDLNIYMYARMKLDGAKGPYFDNNFDNIKSLSPAEKAEIRDRALNAISGNLNAIDKQIQIERFIENEDKLRKLTISEVFNQIASDSGYLMGRVLEAGFQGRSEPGDEEVKPTTNRHLNRLEARKQRKIIGRSYPTIIDSDGGEDLPATNKNTSGDLQPMGVEDAGCEMSLVREFIEALIEGILDVNAAEAVAEDPVDEDIIARISNLEALSQNPYVIASASYQQFAQTILARAAIAAWFTRSFDANRPGSYGNSFFDNDSPEEIRELAEHDFKNVTETLLKNMDPLDRNKLKTFALYWFNLLDSDGENFLSVNQGELENFDLDDFLKDNPGDIVSSEILDFPVVINDAGVLTSQEAVEDTSLLEVNGLNIQYKGAAATQGAEVMTARVLMNDMFSKFGPLGTIDKKTMSGNRFVNNGHLYFKPLISPGTPNNGYQNFILVFEGSDAEKIKSLTSAKSDTEFQGQVVEEANDFMGAIFIDRVSQDGEVREEVEEFNELVRKGQAIKYSAIKDISEWPEYKDETGYSSLWATQGAALVTRDRFRWKKQVEIPGETLSSSPLYGIDASDNIPESSLRNSPIAYMVFYSEKYMQGFVNQVQNVGFRSINQLQRVAFDLWLDEDESQNQRVYMRHFCKLLSEQLQSIEEEEEAFINRTISRAQQGEDVIYRQFKTFWQQWSTVAYSNDVVTGKLVSQDVQDYKGLAVRMMKDYGGGGSDGRGIRLGPGVPLIEGDSREGIFVYDFPLQRIRENSSSSDSKLAKIDVRDSLINIDPLYSGEDSRTTVLNMFQTLCSKNNFMFIPIPGYANYTSVNDIYGTFSFNSNQGVINHFHVMFIPTPESSSVLEQTTYTEPLSLSKLQEEFEVEAFEIRYGSTRNDIVRNISVSTQDNKVTAESAINVQRLADNENRDRTVTKDCSILNVLAGRSYKASVDILGNAQVFPMQFFFIRNLPLFDGLYQILNVKHNITPNNFETSFDGIRMRFSPGDGYGGVYPITIQTLEEEYGQTLVGPLPVEDDFEYIEPTEDNVTAPTEGNQETQGSDNVAAVTGPFNNIIEEYNAQIDITA